MPVRGGKPISRQSTASVPWQRSSRPHIALQMPSLGRPLRCLLVRGRAARCRNIGVVAVLHPKPSGRGFSSFLRPAILLIGCLLDVAALTSFLHARSPALAIELNFQGSVRFKSYSAVRAQQCVNRNTSNLRMRRNETFGIRPHSLFASARAPVLRKGFYLRQPVRALAADAHRIGPACSLSITNECECGLAAQRRQTADPFSSARRTCLETPWLAKHNMRG